MKKILFTVLAVAVTFVACSSSSSNDDERERLSVDERPTWIEVSQNITPQGMFITMDTEGLPYVNGNQIASDSQDILGAFVNGECRGLAAPYAEIDGKTHFYLKVKSTENDQNLSGLKVELKYYSAKLRHLFVAEPFDFVLDGIAGSLDEGYKPKWK